MTEQERQEIKVKLIELGFWGATEQGDPVTDHRDSQTLQERLARLLANGVTLASTGFSFDSPAQGVEVVKGRFVYPLATADSYPEAICLASLTLPEFLRQHPECAADQK